MSKELIQEMRMVGRYYADQTIAKLLEAGADALEAKAAPVGEREAFEAWLGITPCGAAHNLAVKAFQAGAAYQRQSGVVLDNVDEAASILRNMIDSIGTHGNYSNESTLLFLNQALSCLDEFARLNGKEAV